MATGGYQESGAAVKGSGRRSPRSLARTTSIPYRLLRGVSVNLVPAGADAAD